jgi:tetratricopeptide (TPR) repeat protein
MADIGAVLDQALELGEDGRFEEMAQLLARALEDAPDDPYLLGWLGVAEQELGNEGAAYEYFRRCIAEEPLDPNLLALAGAGLAAFDDPEAETALRAAALSGPDVPMARLQYGAYLARAGLYDEALEHLRAARELVPDDPTVSGELGAALALKGDTGAAVAAFEAAVELAPDDAWTWLLLGLLLLEQPGGEEAGAEALVRAAEEMEEDFEAQLLAALAAAARGWEEAAQAALVRAEQAAAGQDADVWREVEERVGAGPAAARALLVESLAASALRERLQQPV